MSYKTMAAKDGIVGICPVLSTGERVQSVHLSGLTRTAVRSDNLDGTFTQLRDGYFAPASGYSYLE